MHRLCTAIVVSTLIVSSFTMSAYSLEYYSSAAQVQTAPEGVPYRGSGRRS